MRTTLAVISIFLLPLAAPMSRAAECALAFDGVVSWWPAEGDANDIADGNHGSLMGGAGFAAGMVGQAFRFDAAGDRVEGPADTAGSNLDLTEAFTLETWVSFNAVNGGFGNAPIVAKWGSTAYGTAGFGVFVLNNGSPGLGVSHNGWDRVWMTSPESLTSGFHHVAGVYTGTEVRLYVDGELEASRDFTGPVFSNDVPILIGGYSPEHTGAPGSLDGLVDEVGIFDRALSEAEIQAIYDAGSVGKCHCGPLPIDDSYGKLVLNRLCTRNASELPGGPGEPHTYDSRTIVINKGANDRFYLSSDGSTFAPLVVDEALHINALDCGLGPYQYQPGVPPFIYDVQIEDNVVPLPAHRIEDSLIPVGLSQPHFELWDTQREIYGNSVIYLVRDCGIQAAKQGGVTLNWVSHDVEIEGFQSNLDVVSGLISELAEDADFSRACFLGSFIATTQAVDDRADPPPGDGYYYLVSGTCASPIGYGDSSLVPDPRDTLPPGANCP